MTLFSDVQFAASYMIITQFILVLSEKEHSSKKTLTTRKIKSVNPNDFSNDNLSPELLTNPPLPHVDDVVCLNNTGLHELPGKHSPITPLKTHSVAQRLRQPWVTDDILKAKRKCHKWKKKARESGATWMKQDFKESCELVKNMMSKAKADYYVNIITESCVIKRNSFKWLINYLFVKRK